MTYNKLFEEFLGIYNLLNEDIYAKAEYDDRSILQRKIRDEAILIKRRFNEINITDQNVKDSIQSVLDDAKLPKEEFKKEYIKYEVDIVFNFKDDDEIKGDISLINSIKELKRLCDALSE